MRCQVPEECSACLKEETLKPTDADRKRAQQWYGAQEWTADAGDGYVQQEPASIIDDIATLIAQVRAEERERAARVADREAEELQNDFWPDGIDLARTIAAAIREGDV